MLRSLKMHGMAQAVGELTEQGSPAFEAALPILSQLLKAETADREVRSTAYQLKAARFPARMQCVADNSARHENPVRDERPLVEASAAALRPNSPRRHERGKEAMPAPPYAL